MSALAKLTKTRPVPIAYGGHEWIVMNELKEYDPLYFHGTSQGIRKIIERKKIPADDVAFAHFVSSRNAWVESTEKYPKSKLLVKKAWVDANVPSMKVVLAEEARPEEVDAPASSSGYDYEAAPAILRLTEEEMFKDADGKPLAIEVRGERHPDRCYFRVKDVSDAFEMPSLKDVLLHHDKGYERGVHYNTFIVRPATGGFRKELFLTMCGFQRVMTSRNKFVRYNINTIQKWVHGLLSCTHEQSYVLRPLKALNNGMIYVVTSPLVNAVKIGYWTSGIRGLKGRYVTTYGTDLELHVVMVPHVRKAEQNIHNHFQDYLISGELFQKEKLADYIAYLSRLGSFKE